LISLRIYFIVADMAKELTKREGPNCRNRFLLEKPNHPWQVAPMRLKMTESPMKNSTHFFVLSLKSFARASPAIHPSPSVCSLAPPLLICSHAPAPPWEGPTVSKPKAPPWIGGVERESRRGSWAQKDSTRGEKGW